MTVLNTSYTTLEEAWGDDFTKKNKKKSSQPKDPLCQLYGRKYQKAKKPFLDKSVEVTNGKNYKTTGMSSRNRYFGYNDENMSDNKESECIQHNKKRTSVKSKRNSKKKGVRFNIETEDDDDVYLYNAIKDEEILNEQDFHDDDIDFEEMNNVKQFYDDVYEESDNEDYDLPENEDPTVDIEEEQVYFNPSSNKKNLYCSNQYKDERQYFDLIIYILSGIILIFMMEQFIQIGMRLKNSTTFV